MDLDVVALSRLQFALTIMFHYLFPPLTIGLGVLLVIIEWLWLKTNDRIYESMAHFWTKIFAVNFAIGTATGIVMEFEFGTNWATYSRFVGDVFGSALAAEGIFAFFLESGFLAVLVFGWDKVSRGMHFFSTCMVALGSIFSSIWIVIANSWQQTPTGFHVVQRAAGFQRAEIVDFWAMVFNPSTIPRLTHVWLGSFILGAFFAMSVCAFYILKGQHEELAKRNFKIALIYGLIASLAAPLSGHFHAHEVATYQPAKLAAFEAHFKTGEGGSPFYLFGLPDPEKETVIAGLAVPGVLSFLAHGNFNEPVMGLDAFKKEDRPPIVIPFFAFHLMVYLGMMFVFLCLLAAFLIWRGKLFQTRWLLWSFVFAVGGAFAANQLGWIAAEVGRQPWVVYGLLRTKDAVSKSVPASDVLASMLLFGAIYSLLFWVWVYVLHQKITHGPEYEVATPSQTTPESLLEAASRLVDASGYSLTTAKEEDQAKPSEGQA